MGTCQGARGYGQGGVKEASFVTCRRAEEMSDQADLQAGKELSRLRSFVAGWFAGAAGLVVGHPFDTVKARLQTDTTNKYGNKFRTISCFKQVATKEGPLALYKGMLSPLIGMAAINAIVFGMYENVMKHLQPEGGLPKIPNSFIAGAVGGSAQVWICCPMELIKLRMQCQEDPRPLLGKGEPSGKRIYKDPWDCIKKLYGNSGVRRGIIGLNNGFAVTAIREVPAFASYFASYDYQCRLLLRRKNSETMNDLHPLELCVAGGISGIVAWVVVYPLDVVKTRLQVDGMFGERKYKGIIDCFLKCPKEELEEMRIDYKKDPTKYPKPSQLRAYRVFVKGINSTILRAFPLNAVTFTTYSLIMRHWSKSST